QIDLMSTINNEDDGDSTDEEESEYSDLEEEDVDSDESDGTIEDDSEGEEEEEDGEDEEDGEGVSDVEGEDEEEDVDDDDDEGDDEEEEDIEIKKKKVLQKTKSEISNDKDEGSKESLIESTKDASKNNKSKSNTDKSKSSSSSSSGLKKAESEGYGTGEGEEDEYKEDSSDEEDLRNTIGKVPLKWYDEYEHIGYDLDGKPVPKPKRGDTLDNFLNRLENPDFERTVLDKQTGQDVRLSDADLDVVRRVLGHKVPDSKYDMYETWHDLYSHEVMDMPVTGRPEHKRSFVPSKDEMRTVARWAEIIKNKGVRNPRKDKRFIFRDIWRSDTEGEKVRGVHNPMPAPKTTLPGHGESYNPPPEYLPSEKEKKEQRKLKWAGKDPGLRRRKINSIREIPSYRGFLKERYERCLDLYLAPRKRVIKINAKSKDLIPNIPNPRDLRPFPTTEELIFKGHRSIIRTISMHPKGKYLASGSDDYTVKIWEVSTGRCLRSFEIGAAVKCVSWNPNPKLFLLAVVADCNVIFLSPESYLMDKSVVAQTNSIFKEEPDQGDYIVPERVAAAVKWVKPTPEEWAQGYRIKMEHFKMVKQIVWHKQGDYFSTVMPEGQQRSVLMHQLSRWRSQVPFNKIKGRVQAVQFHPKHPFLFVATQGHIRVYNLQKQLLTKKVQANSRWISNIAVHPGGEHFLISGWDKRLNWFEMECTRRPHLLRYHKAAVRAVSFHRKYPLFASCGDEGRIIVSHGMVYNDWLKDPLLVPVKELVGHAMFDDLHVLDLTWHPYEPYLITAGADATIRLWR
ncbi:unnamed protein product, partial [Meganyctiphanes norvegica]